MLEIHFIIISIEIISLIVGIAILWFYKQSGVKKPSEPYKEIYSDYLNSEKCTNECRVRPTHHSLNRLFYAHNSLSICGYFY